MSIENITKFAHIAAKDNALVKRLGIESLSADQASVLGYAEKAVAEGKALGLDFSQQEVLLWTKNEADKYKNGVLSDADLEVVAGGSKAGAKAFGNSVVGGLTTAGNWIAQNPVLIASVAGGIVGAGVGAAATVGSGGLAVGLAAAGVGAIAGACGIGGTFHR